MGSAAAAALLVFTASISYAEGSGNCWVDPQTHEVVCKAAASAPGKPAAGGGSGAPAGGSTAQQAQPISDNNAPEYGGPGSSSPFIMGNTPPDPTTGLTAPCPLAGPAVCNVPAAPAAPGAPAPPPPSPAQLAQQAYQQLALAKPTIGTAPCADAGCMGAVGVPVWLWTQPWQAQSATAAAGGISVTVTAKITKVTWSMGDGTKIPCASRGTPYNVSMGFRDSPDCGYRYQKTSATQPAQKYTVAATAAWTVTWTGAYIASTTVTTTSTTQLAIGEYQVLVTS